MALSAFTLAPGAPPADGADWLDWRGPARDGRSPETGLPSSWSPDGENLLWSAPYGGRSTPVIGGERLFLQNPVGEGPLLQERIMALDAGTGRVLWEHRVNIAQSDVPPHRLAWASPAVDPDTGNVYAFTVGGTLLAFDARGELLWDRSLQEEFGLITTHGGRTSSPIVDGDLVIVSGLTSGWGDQARGGHRFFGFDKASGETVWASTPGVRPYDTTYSPPLITEIGGIRLLIVGGGDGAVHALKPQTGETVWRYEYSKRGINSGVAVRGSVVFVSQGEENTDTSEMGLLTAIDGNARGEIPHQKTLWRVTGFMGGYSSPVLDGDRLYQIDNSANLVAFDTATGRKLWTLSLGTIQRASPVLADGKIYVGSENGKFYILKPGADGVQILDQDQLGTEDEPVPVTASVAVAHGRVYIVSRDAVYCIGQSRQTPSAASAPSPAEALERSTGTPTHVQVVPTELILAPGQTVRFEARLYDEKGRFIGPAPDASWSLEGLQGTFAAPGQLKVASDATPRAGVIKAIHQGVTGTARARVIPPLPWNEDFESLTGVPAHWIAAAGKFEIREMEGQKVLAKTADNPFLKRARVYMGPPEWSNYTIEVDVRGAEMRRQLGDGGVVAQRYALILFGNHQRLELQAWQPETQRTVKASYAWQPDTWYRLKLTVENLAEGTVRARGKVWPRSEPEPAEWQVERVDPIPNQEGSPGIYADAHYEVYFDNLKVVKNP